MKKNGIKSTNKNLVVMLDDLLSYLIIQQNIFAKEYLINTKLHSRVENSLVKAKYSFNYLNLNPTQTGGNQIKDWKKKYYKYKHKYMKFR